MSSHLNESDFTQALITQLQPLEVSARAAQPLLVEIHYGEGEPVLSIPLKSTYEQYKEKPEALDELLLPYVREIGWTVQPPRYSVQQIIENTMPLMRDLQVHPIPQHGDKTTVNGHEIVLSLSKGPVLFQEMIERPDEHLAVQFVLDFDGSRADLHLGDTLTFLPDPEQVANIAIQNLAARALQSGLTVRNYQVENLSTEFILVGFRDESLRGYVASLLNVPDVMLKLQDIVEAPQGLLVSIPTRDRMIICKDLKDNAICELWLLARHVKNNSQVPVSNLIWKVKDGEIEGVQTVTLKEDNE